MEFKSESRKINSRISELLGEEEVKFLAEWRKNNMMNEGDKEDGKIERKPRKSLMERIRRKKDKKEEKEEKEIENKTDEKDNEDKSEIIKEFKEEIVKESQDEIIKENKEEVVKEDKEQIVQESKGEIVKEDKEQIVPENKEEITEDDKKDLVKEDKKEIVQESIDKVEENKEEITEENKKEIVKEDKEQIVTENKEQIIKENQEEIVKEDKEQIVGENKDEILHENKEEIVKENKEEITEENKNIIPSNHSIEKENSQKPPAQITQKVIIPKIKHKINIQTTASSLKENPKTPISNPPQKHFPKTPQNPITRIKTVTNSPINTQSNNPKIKTSKFLKINYINRSFIQKKPKISSQPTSSNTKKEDSENSKTPLSSGSKNFDQTYARLISNHREVKDKIDAKRKEKFSNEMAEVTGKPSINLGTKMISAKITKDFLQRQYSFEKKKKEKTQRLADELKRKKEEEINKGVKKSNKEKGNFNEKLIEFKKWQEKRKEKIQAMKKIKEDKEVEEIKKYKENRKKRNNYSQEYIDSIAIRLYKEDVEKRNLERELLMSLYQPTFEPFI